MRIAGKKKKPCAVESHGTRLLYSRAAVKYLSPDGERQPAGTVLNPIAGLP